jgi:2-keto-4-pentenoate hydratase/2-oxohepta-3-ene-1,7-dioic acid hydratase in catechol pathway
MKLATARVGGRESVVVVNDADQTARVVEGVKDMLDLIARWGELKDALTLAGQPIALDKLEVLAPIPRPSRNVFCVGKNYREHAKEFTKSGFDSSAKNEADAIPDHPIIFSKVPECIIANGDDIRYPTGVSTGLDYEAELVAVIGKGGRGITRADAMKHVFGYAVFNDVTARDLQSRHKQWLIGKSLDTFGPFGPWLVTADAIDAENLEIKCWVNGELRQSSNTKDLIFDIPTLIEALSAGLTLYPGDVIATGTPAGVGIGFTPPRYLVSGDVVAVEITNLGRLENKVV